MKINSYNETPIERNQKVLWIIGAIFMGGVAVFLLYLFVDLSVWLYNFVKDYWHFIILALILILFVKRWFKKKEIVVQKQPEVEYG